MTERQATQWKEARTPHRERRMEDNHPVWKGRSPFLWARRGGLLRLGIRGLEKIKALAAWPLGAFGLIGGPASCWGRNCP